MKTTELNVVEYIKKNSLQKLIETFSLRANYHKEYPNLVQLCYHQLDTSKNDITDNCRGLILDINDDYKVISFPFTRFGDYDYKNPKKNKIDFDNCRYYRKEDGSIVTLYFYDNKWHISTKGLPDASGEVKGLDITYNDYFWKVFKEKGFELPKNTKHCYIFELIIPIDSFLVNSKTPEIILTGMRNLETLEEVDIYNTTLIPENWEKVKFWCYTLAAILDDVRYVDPTTFEGYVACDNNFNRVKIKSPQYEAINQLRIINPCFYKTDQEYQIKKLEVDKNNFRRICEIVRTNEHFTFLDNPKYISIKEQYFDILGKYYKLKRNIQKLLNECEGLEGKELGLKLKENQEFNGLVFGIRQGRIKNVNDWLYDIDIKKFETLIRTIKE